MDERDGNPKRRWFQFRLSTLVAMMIAASVLVWANVQESYFVPERHTARSGYLITGWPFTYYYQYGVTNVDGSSSLPWKVVIEWWGLVGNIAMAILIIGLVGALFEFFARRRTR